MHSTETFNHSVNVACLMYCNLANDSNFMVDEAYSYAISALIHDAGKILIEDEILHDPRDFRFLPETERSSILAKMNSHASLGLSLSNKYNFRNSDILACIGHHQSVLVINGMDVPDDPIVKFHVDNSSQKDLYFLKELCFIDKVEALRASDRSYRKSSIPWCDYQDEKNRTKFGINSILSKNIEIEKAAIQLALADG